MGTKQKIWTVVVVYNGDLELVNVFGTKEKAEAKYRKLCGEFTFVELYEMEII